MDALEIHNAIQATPVALHTDTIDRLLDINTMLNDRMSELERRCILHFGIAKTLSELPAPLSSVPNRQ